MGIDWTPRELEAGRNLWEVKEEAWNLVYILELQGHPSAGGWDSRLRDFEDAYVENNVWLGALGELRRLTTIKG